MLGDVARFALGTALLCIVGRAACRRRNCGLALQWVLGSAILIPVLLVWGLIGLPLTAISMVALAAVTITIAALAGGNRGATRHELAIADADALARLSRIVLWAACAIFAAKTIVAPLWSWDHFAHWGLPARRLLTDGMLDLSFLRVPGLNSDYPLGVAMLWRFLALGHMPNMIVFKLAHIGFGLGAIDLARRASLEVGAGRASSNTIAAYLAVSPLLWDTVYLGIADLPLALFAVAAAGFLLRAGALEPRARICVGVLIGFLPWIKKEGLVLAVLLLGAAAIIRRVRRAHGWVAEFAAIAAVAMGIAAVAKIIEYEYLGPGLSFLAGDWLTRGMARIPQAPEIAAALAREALALDWLGVWILFPIAVYVAWRRRRKAALAVSGIVCAQVLGYVFVYFATYLPPVAHIESSFFRVLGALEPLALIVIADLFVKREAPGAMRGEISAAAIRV
jgi:hypothetical protein